VLAALEATQPANSDPATQPLRAPFLIWKM